ncbi:MAG: tRNA lysidine(34) synthetase TilS [Pirellula sp.]
MHRVLESILRDWPIDRWSNSTIVLAISGGPDSVAMLRAIHGIIEQANPPPNIRLVVAHLNHRLRGDQSDLDEAFVKQLACELKLDAISDTLPQSAESRGEAQWRKARMSFLRDVAKQYQANWIATGATADDSVETMFHHLLRGSGPAGLSGIRLERKLSEQLSLVHPLIGLWKAELIEYLDSLGQEYRTDKSNLSNNFTRNRIRNECLPYLEAFTGCNQLKERLRVTCELIRQEHQVIEELAQQWLETSAIEWGQDQIEVEFSQFARLPWPVLQCGFVGIWHRMGWPLQQISFRHWDRVRKWIDSARDSNHPTRMQLPGPIELKIARRKLQIRKRN